MARPTPYVSEARPDGEAPSFFDGREAIAIVIERAWLAIAVAAAVLLYFWYDTHRQTPYYRSKATVLVEAQIPHLSSFQEAAAFGARNIEFFNTHIKALHSRTMMEQAIADGGLADRPGFTPGVGPGPQQVEAALRFVRISPVERSRLIEITAEHPDPEIAADLANALARSYIQQDLDNRMGVSIEAVEWLRARAEEFRERLEEGLLALQRYREETQSVSLEEDQNIVLARLKDLNNALTGAQTARIAVETEWASIRQQLEAGESPTDIALLLEQDGVREARRQWRAQEQAMEAVRQRYLSGHPDYREAEERLALLRRQFEQAAEQAVEALRERYAVLRERETNLRAALRAQEQEAFDLDRQLVRYNEMRRNVEADEKVYQAVIARMNEAALSGSLPASLIRMVDEARPARAPFRPNPRRALLRGGAIGAVLGLAAVFGLYFADHRFRRNEEVERALGLGVLATLPLVRSRSLTERALSAHLADAGDVAESVRTLRASLMMDPETRAARCLMVTSTHAGEGKTLVATNLAVSFAQDGQRTLLMGVDLRRPALHRVFGQPRKPGLAEVLKDEISWRGGLIEHEIPGLDVLPAGVYASRPAEQLGGRGLSDLLAELRKTYDRIVMDAPPILGVSDGLILLANVDRVLFVVRFGATHSLSARQAVRRITHAGVPCAGVVMNGVNLRSISNYYYYRRYGTYGYRYRAEPATAEGVAE